MEILFSLTGMNKNNLDCLLLSVIDDIKLKNSEPKKGILVYYFEGVEFVRQFTKYEDLYEFIRKHEDSLKKQKATTFATLDVLNQDLNQIYDSLENFLSAYYNNIPHTFSIQFSLSNNVYNLVLMETVLSTFDSNKINLYLHRFKNTPVIDTLISLYIKETKLPRINLTKFNTQSNIKQSNQLQNNDDNIFTNTQKIQNNVLTKSENQTILLQEIKNLLNEFKRDILNNIFTVCTNQNLNKYQLNLIDLIKQSNIDDKQYQLIYNAIKTILNNSNSISNTDINNKQNNNVFDSIAELNLNDII